MEFDTGPDVQPGHDITIDTSSGSQDLGEATYDSDHDGVADSVVVIDGDHEYVITDSNHDGTADSMHEYNSSGQEIDPKTGATIGGDGSTSPTGTDAGDHSAPDTGNSSSGTDSTGTDTGAADHTGSSTDSGASSTAGSTVAGHDITVTGDDGSAHSLGAPTVDMDQDGSPDTAIVHNPDGSVTGYTDRDGDGNADQITQIGADGKVVIAIADGHGGWEVASTGHLDASGNLVPDSTPDPAASLDGTDTDGVTTGHPGTAGTDHTGTDHTSTSTGTEPVPNSAPISGAAPAGDITFSDGGKDYDLGHPTTDLDGDGTPDTVVTHLADGTVVGYSDTDGDGTADQVTQISPDGQVVIGVSDGHGGWEQAATGRLDADGKFVPDSSTAGVSAGSTTG